MKSNRRLLSIIKYLETHSKTSYKEISDHLSLAENIVRYEIENLNYYIDVLGLPAIEKISGGIISHIDDFATLYSHITEIYVISLTERRDYLAYKLVMNGVINISTETQNVNVSRNTIKADLKDLTLKLKENEISVISRKIATASEDAIRSFLFNRFAKHYLSLFYLPKQKLVFHMVEAELKMAFKAIDMSELAQVISKITKNYQYTGLYETFTICLLIAIQRIQRNHIIQNKYENYIVTTEEYQEILAHKESLESITKLSFPPEEIIKLADILLSYGEKTFSVPLQKNLIQIKLFVAKLIASVSRDLGKDLQPDSVLIDGLYKHMHSTIYRAQNSLRLDSGIYLEAAQKYAGIFEIVLKNVKNLEGILSITLSDEEIALVMIHILGAIRRYDEDNEKAIRLLLLCNSGYGTSILLKNLLEANYNAKVLDVLSVYQLSAYDCKEIDLIVTTIKFDFDMIEKNLPPLLYITPFLTFDDDALLLKFGVQRKKRKQHTKEDLLKILDVIKKHASIHDMSSLMNGISKILMPDDLSSKESCSLFDNLSPAQITIVDSLTNWQKSLVMCSRSLIEDNVISKEYTEEIFHSIRLFGPHFIIRNHIAIPHANERKGVKRSGMHVLYIRQGTLFPDDYKVRLIFFIAAKEKRKLLNTVMKISSISNYQNLYQDLEKTLDNKEQLVQFLKYFTSEGEQQ